MGDALPEFVEPMLCRLGEPFDSKDHWYEVKWDGIRALAFVEGGDYRLLSRRRNELAPRYPELALLKSLEPGLVLDGEIVVLADGRPSFELALRREQARGGIRISSLAQALPATYVVFDVLYRRHRSVLGRPLSERRELLCETVAACGDPRLVLSDGVVGEGLRFFREVRKLELEGMVAKRLSSSYLPGRRTDAWTKVKAFQRLHCAIVGYALDESNDLKSLIIAADDEGELRCVGKVGSGLSGAMRSKLLELLRARPRAKPLVDCGMDGEWVEPGLYCTVSYLERTSAGNLRAPVFLELIADP